MKKILIVTNNMNIGGIQKSLLELLKALSKRADLSVSVFCSSRSGDYLQRIPEGVSVLPENLWAKVSELSIGGCKQMGLRYFAFRFFASAWSKLFHKGLPAALLCALIGDLGTYDIAISFSQPIHDKAFNTLTNEIVQNCCRAKRKVTFVHCDFEKYGGNTRRNRRLYTRFDAVAAVSESVGEVMKRCIPAIESRVYTVYNCCDREEILRLADTDPVCYRKKTFVTVARLSEEKGLLRCVPIFAKLKKQNLDFAWHIVGGGTQKAELKAAIGQYGMEKNIFLEGQQTNPYRFLKNADFLLLPSFHEAAPMVFDEAIVLNVPILSTNTLSAKELVADRHAGYVCGEHEEDLYGMLFAALHADGQRRKTAPVSEERKMKQFDAACGIEEYDV